MNRRELLAAGVGLGGLALTSKASLACCGADEEKKGDAVAAGLVYCPMFPYIFCGSYTLYYAVQLISAGNCGGTPASMAGPNNLVLGCGGTGCQATFKSMLTAKAAAVGGNHVSHKKIKMDGMVTSPTSVGHIDGVHLSKKILNVKNAGGVTLFYARVYDVTVIKNELDKAELLTVITQADIDKIANVLEYFPGHESGAPTAGETAVDAKQISVEGHTCIVESSSAGNQQYLVVRK